MSYEAINHGLKMEPNRSQWGPLIPTPSMTPVWKFVEHIPIPHLLYQGPDDVVWR